MQYAEDINALAEEEQELEALDKSLDKTCTRYKMAISAEKTKLIINSANSIQKKIKVKGQQLGTVTSLKYIGVIVSDEGSRMVQATAALTMRIDKNISLMKGETDALSCHIIFLHACMSWTLTAEIEKRANAFEMLPKFTEHLIQGPCHHTRRKIQAAIEIYDELLTLI